MPNNYNNIGRLRPDKSDLDEALEVAWISLKKNKETNDKIGIARDYNNIGQILKDKGDLDEALKYGKMALVIDEELNDLFQMATDYFNVISLCYLKKNKKDELFYLKKLKGLLDQVPEYSHMDYIMKRIMELENKSGETKED
jgi:tetratricopeptide (TPR) repeat protein